MAFRHRATAVRRSVGAALIGAALVLLFGPELLLPALALVALVYYAHQVAAAAAGDASVPYPSLAFVIVVNSLIVLMVQLVVFVAGLETA